MDDYLLGAAKLTKNAGPEKYGCRCYDIGFHACWQFSLSNGKWGKNIVTFGVSNSSSVHTDNWKKIF